MESFHDILKFCEFELDFMGKGANPGPRNQSTILLMQIYAISALILSAITVPRASKSMQTIFYRYKSCSDGTSTKML